MTSLAAQSASGADERTESVTLTSPVTSVSVASGETAYTGVSAAER